MEQLIVVLMILVFTGGDMLVRWLRKRNEQSPPPSSGERREEPVGVLEDEMEEEPDWFEELQRKQREQYQERTEPERWEREQERAETSRQEASRQEAARQEAEQAERVRAERVRSILFPAEEAAAPEPLRIPIESLAPARGVPVARARRPAALRTHAPGRVGGVPIREWLRNSEDAKRGIVLMSVLGPCKGLE